MYYCYGKGVQKSVLCREVVLFSEGPLLEVPLYYTIILEEEIIHRVCLCTTTNEKMGRILKKGNTASRD